MTVAEVAAIWNDIVAMGLIVLGYGIVAAGFYALIAKTAKTEPNFDAMLTAAPQQATVIDLTAELYEKKAA
jgi:hypothetical protein